MTTDALRREFEDLMTKHRLPRGVMYADYMSGEPEIIRPELLRFAEAVCAAGRAAAGKDTEDAERYRKLFPMIEYREHDDGYTYATLNWCVDLNSKSPKSLDEAIDAANGNGRSGT
jgi:hypothetical protein